VATDGSTSGRPPITFLALLPTFFDNKVEKRNKYVLIEAMSSTSISRALLILTYKPCYINKLE